MTLHEEKLSYEKHFVNVGDFYCGADSPLDNFICSDAFKYDEQRYGVTYILTASEEANDILGFYTSIGFKKANKEVQNEIAESFNEKCDLYMVSLDDIKD